MMGYTVVVFVFVKWAWTGQAEAGQAGVQEGECARRRPMPMMDAVCRWLWTQLH
jgi:hypothetical protein